MGSKARAPTRGDRGVRVADVRRRLLRLPGVAEGRSYGLPSFLVNGRFLARFGDAKAFFCTDHYRDYPAVLIRLAEVPRDLLATVVEDAWRHGAAQRAPRARKA